MAEGSEDRPLLSHRSRLAGMLFEPRRVMEHLARQPRWILPVALSLVPSAIFTIGIWFRAPTFMDDIHSIGSLAVDLGAAFLRELVLFAAGFVAQAAVVLLSALTLAGLIRALSRTLSVRHSLALVSYSLVPEILVCSANAVIWAGVAAWQLEPPPNYLRWLSVAAFVNGSGLHPMVRAIVGQIGVLSIWRWLLVALGITIVVRSVSFRVAFGVAVVALVLVGSIWNFAWISATRLFIPALP